MWNKLVQMNSLSGSVVCGRDDEARFPSKEAFWHCGLHCSEDQGMHPKCRRFRREYSPLTVGAYWVEDSGLHLSCSRCSLTFCLVNRLDIHGHSLVQQQIWLLERGARFLRGSTQKSSGFQLYSLVHRQIWLLQRGCWVHWCFRGATSSSLQFRANSPNL